VSINVNEQTSKNLAYSFHEKKMTFFGFNFRFSLSSFEWERNSTTQHGNVLMGGVYKHESKAQQTEDDRSIDDQRSKSIKNGQNFIKFPDTHRSVLNVEFLINIIVCMYRISSRKNFPVETSIHHHWTVRHVNEVIFSYTLPWNIAWLNSRTESCVGLTNWFVDIPVTSHWFH
jgi:hypothetical protein